MEEPEDPFKPDLPGIENFPPEFQRFAEIFIGEANETANALWGQESFQKALTAVEALDEEAAKAALLRILTHLKLADEGADWLTRD